MWFWFFIGSVLLNIFLAFYIRWLLKTLSVINTEVEDTSKLIQNFSNHVESIHELEMFYGDQTLQDLMKHGKDLAESLKDIDLIVNTEDEAPGEESTDEAS
mgnify:FL=1